DEIMTNLASAPTLERLRACRQAMDEVYEQTGRRVLYAVNVTSNVTNNVGGHPLATARQLVASGANALLLNVLTYGFAALEAIAADPDIDVPIFVHPAFAGALCASKDTGMAYSVVLGTLMAHGGADAVLYPAHYGSLPFDPMEEASIRDSLRQRNVFPVPSAGIHPGIVPRALADYGNEVVLNAGTGIMDHPAGAAAGVRAFFEALAWHRQGKSWDVAEMPECALRQAVEKWGK
ncbi:MAG: 2,3-diketo-5-methylthiopentyl-1-phosphate enolase, partial [Coleofasciculaceae cyanobacterium SM2_3_26]|nr:2,3-diketo-5-methylthiopentyl-1-phosphate enolase [Coleofasciculaceae cyanobacterium SM2_3_26]